MRQKGSKKAETKACAPATAAASVSAESVQLDLSKVRIEPLLILRRYMKRERLNRNNGNSERPQESDKHA